jgi:3-keto-disaccharide hydrolase
MKCPIFVRLSAVSLLLAIAGAAVLRAEEGFTPLFNGKTLDGWQGGKDGYVVQDESIVSQPRGSGNLATVKEYGDFHLKFEFKLTAGANNGIGIRVPSEEPGQRIDPAYKGMEIQVLDDASDRYKNIQPWQHHGSVYGVVPAKTGFLKPAGEWNSEEIIARGKQITVVLNGTTIVDADIAKASENGTIDGKEHPGLKRDSGHICFCGHGAEVWFRNLRIRELK